MCGITLASTILETWPGRFAETYAAWLSVYVLISRVCVFVIKLYNFKFRLENSKERIITNLQSSSYTNIS